MIYQDDMIQIFFGDKRTAFYPDNARGKTSDILMAEVPFSEIQAAVPVPFKAYVFAHQVHGITGAVVSKDKMQKPLFIEEGDYLVTDLSRVGIGIATADCVPVVIVDPVHKAVAAIHAGWRGLAGGVVEQALETLRQEYGAAPEDLKVFVGASAHACCYEVSQGFVDQAASLRPEIKPLVAQMIVKKGDKLFFDTNGFLKVVLIEKGLLEGSFNFSQSRCTMCEPGYCSYRREKMSPLRQLTIVSLK